MAEDESTEKKIDVAVHSDDTSSTEPAAQNDQDQPQEQDTVSNDNAEKDTDPVNEITPPPAPEAEESEPIVEPKVEPKEEPQPELKEEPESVQEDADIDEETAKDQSTEPTDDSADALRSDEDELSAEPESEENQDVDETQKDNASSEADVEPAPVVEPPDQKENDTEAQSEAVPPSGVVSPPPAEDSSESVQQQVDEPKPSNDIAAEDMVAGVSASQAAKHKKHPHRNNKKFAAIVTVIIGAILSALAVYLYVSATNNTQESSQNRNANSDNSQQLPTNNEDPVEPATEQDVNETTQDVDQALEALDDASDLAEEDLSDDSLGL